MRDYFDQLIKAINKQKLFVFVNIHSPNKTNDQVLFFEEIQRQLGELQPQEKCEVNTEDDFNTLNPNTAYSMRKKYCTCVNYLFLVLLQSQPIGHLYVALYGRFCNYESK